MCPADTISACLRLPAFWRSALCAEAAAILVLSVIPAMDSGINGGLPAHAAAYTVFSCTAGLLLTAKKTPLPAAGGACIAVVFGSCIEVAQYFIPFRACEPADFAVNICASLAGMAAAEIGRRALFQTAAPRKKHPAAPAAKP